MKSCTWCGSDRGKEGTGLCDNCWEIGSRVQDLTPRAREHLLESLGMKVDRFLVEKHNGGVSWSEVAYCRTRRGAEIELRLRPNRCRIVPLYREEDR